MNKLNLILRTCDRVHAFSSNKKRDFGEKADVMRKCMTSIRESINFFTGRGGEVQVDIVDDNSSNEMVSFINQTLPYNFVKLQNRGNGNSFKQCIELAKTKNGLVFLVEDDYLMLPECIHSMVTSYNKIKNDINQEICMYPSDYPDRYKDVYRSYILLGTDRHYRQIKQTTCTFMCSSSVILEFEPQLANFYNYGIIPGICEENSINLMYHKYMCFSPIPSLAEHYQHIETLSPFYVVRK